MSEYDYTFLEQPQRFAGRTLVYRYRTGIWKKRLMEAALRSSQGNSVVVGPATMVELLGGANLFTDSRGLLCDVGVVPTLPVLEMFVADLDREFPRLSLLVVDYESEVVGNGKYTKGRSELWTRILQHKRVVELVEPELSPGTLGPIVRFLAQNTDLATDPACCRQPGFLRCFGDLVEARAGVDQAVHRFDVLLASSDPQTNLVNVDREIVAASTRASIPSITAFLHEPSDAHIERAVWEIRDAMERGRSVEAIVRLLVAKVVRLLRAASGSSSGVPVRRILGFAGHVIANWTELETLFLSSTMGSLPVTFDRLLRSVRSSDACEDPLTGQWREIAWLCSRASLAGDLRAAQTFGRLTTAVREAVTALPDELRPYWARRLMAHIAQRQPRGGKKVSEAQYPIDFDLPGQGAGVYAVRAALAAAKEAINKATGEEIPSIAPLLIHGPASGARRSLARLSARAFLCESSELICGACPSCIAFDQGTLGDGGVLTANRHDIALKVHEYVEGVRNPTLATKWVLRIEEVERAGRVALDAMLKTLEEQPPGVLFILMATDVERVREAIRSRCLEVELI